MKITRKQLRQIIKEEARIVKEGDEVGTWEEVRAQMASLGGQLLAYDGTEGRRIYFFPGGLDVGAAHARVQPMGYKVVGRANKGSNDWEKIPNMTLSGTIVRIDKQ